MLGVGWSGRVHSNAGQEIGVKFECILPLQLVQQFCAFTLRQEENLRDDSV